MKSEPFASLKGASRLLVLLGILCAGCTINPLQERAEASGRVVGEVVVDPLLPPDTFPPIEPWIPRYGSAEDDTTKPVTKPAIVPRET